VGDAIPRILAVGGPTLTDARPTAAHVAQVAFAYAFTGDSALQVLSLRATPG